MSTETGTGGMRTMRKVVLFIAVSLDGYLADKNGGVEYLAGQDAGGEEGDAYSSFIQTVDTVVMGWNTYHQVVTELSPEAWVYSDLMSYVVTHRALPSTERIQFVSQSPAELVRSLKEWEGRDIWICGGADIAQQLMKAELIDRLHLSIVPTLLGGGIRLFGELQEERKLRLLRTSSCNGIIEAVYERR